MTQKGITLGQISQIARLGEDAVRKSIIEFGLNSAEAQIVINRGGEFAAQIYSAARNALLELKKGRETILPTELVIGGRMYEILSFLKGDEERVSGNTMIERAKEMHANLGQEDGEYFMKHQDGIPAELRDKIAFIFADWRHPSYPDEVSFLCWYDGRWIQSWRMLFDDWSAYSRLPRRK